MRVAVFDSGIGGLTVVKSLLKSKLFEEIIYFGDTARVPYGVKDKNTIIRYALEALEFFKNFEVDMMIVACNTVSAYALEELRANASFPIFGVIESGVLAIKDENKNSNILIIGTKATINSKEYENRLKNLGYQNIISKSTTLFVPIVEEGIFSGDVLDSTMNYYFNNIKNIDILILGCTHFPLIAQNLSNYFDGAKTVHSGDAIVKHLESNFEFKNRFQKTKIEFFASENPTALKSVAKSWLGDLIE
jgi:glutamate racemase